MKLNLRAVEERVAPLGGRASYDREFIFELLLAYGRSQGNVTRLRNGSLNVADDKTCEVAQKNVVYFKETTDDPLAVIDELRTAPAVVRYSPRFVIVTDYTELLAVDTKTGENFVIPIAEIDKHFTFFLPWAGMEKAQYVAEAHADVKAAERMGKLFDELLAANPDLLTAPHGRHALNVFFTRLLFCFFAEDTGIFAENQFTNAVGSHTQPDGSDVAEFLTALFIALDTAHAGDKPAHLAGFPYVNGRLFMVQQDHVVPVFTKKARDLLIESGTLIWREINPDIFGSMFQAIVTPGKRSDLGQHYTSVPNILKTIEPLFLNGLKDELDAAYDSSKKLEALLERISAIKIFDPACGSGNFLVIAYKELRRIEHTRLALLRDAGPPPSLAGPLLNPHAIDVRLLQVGLVKGLAVLRDDEFRLVEASQQHNHRLRTGELDLGWPHPLHCRRSRHRHVVVGQLSQVGPGSHPVRRETVIEVARLRRRLSLGEEPVVALDVGLVGRHGLGVRRAFVGRVRLQVGRNSGRRRSRRRRRGGFWRRRRLRDVRVAAAGSAQHHQQGHGERSSCQPHPCLLRVGAWCWRQGTPDVWPAGSLIQTLSVRAQPAPPLDVATTTGAATAFAWTAISGWDSAPYGGTARPAAVDNWLVIGACGRRSGHRSHVI